jgi:hypothetical protein
MQSSDKEVVLLSMRDLARGVPSFTAVVIHNRRCDSDV